MKRYIFAFLVGISFLFFGFFNLKAFAAYGVGGICSLTSNPAPNDADNFPFGFLCGGDNTDTSNVPFIDGSGGLSDGYRGGGSPGAGSNYYTVSGSTTMNFSTGFNSKRIPCSAQNCSTPARVLVWVTIDANYSTPPVSVSKPGGVVNAGVQISPAGSVTVDTDGHITNCPGSLDGPTGPGSNSYALTLNNGPPFGAGETGAIYNYYTGEPSDPINASPAYDPLDPSKGQEDCRSEGQMIYWVLSDVDANASPRFRFKINVNANNTGQYAAFCVRENVSVQYPNGLSNSFTNFAKHLAKQSERHCYQVAPRPPTGSLTGNCASLTVNNGGVTFGASAFRTNTIVNVSNVAQLVGAGFTDGNATGGYPIAGQQNGIVGWGNSKTWSYIPTNSSLTITTYNIYHNTNTGQWHRVPGSTSSRTINCLTATCNLSITGDGPGGQVLAGGTMHVTATMTNTSSGPPPQPLPDPLGGYNLGFDVNSGSVSVPLGTGLGPPGSGINVGQKTFDMPAAASISVIPRYLGHFALGPNCGPPISLNYAFHLVPHALVCTAGCDEENPVGINYRTYVDNTTSYTVNGVPQGSSAVFTAYGAGPSPPDGNNPAAQNFAPGSPPGNNTLNGPFIVRSFAAGDQYCATVTLTSYTDGLVDSAGNVIGGTTSTSGVRIDGSGHAYDKQCLTVRNKPYFRVRTSSIFVGGNFAPGCLNPGGKGTLASWNNNNFGIPNASAGSGADYSSVALGIITGFGSGINKSLASPGGVANGAALSFANTGGVVTSSDNDSPKMGGQFAPNHCIKKLTTPPNNPAPMSSPNKLRPLQAASFPSGSYTHTSGPGGLEIDQPVPMSPKNIELYVDGDVYISKNITYVGGGSPGTASSFILHVVNGNIYIDPDVTELDGYYVAEGSSSTTGKIYTCATAAGPLTKNNLYGCNKQLIVWGGFAANQVNLMRTYGSLRNARVVAAGCSNAVISNPTTCAAEVFEFTPELYLSKPASGVSSDFGKYDSITSLPPVL
jgi:hypothetical protein